MKIVECLVKKGNAYVLAENNAGATPLHYLVLNDACEETALFLEILVCSIHFIFIGIGVKILIFIEDVDDFERS